MAPVQHSLKESGSGANRGPQPVAKGSTPAQAVAGRASDAGVTPLPAWEPVVEVAPPKIPNFEPAPNSTSSADARWEHTSDPPFPVGVVHPYPGGHRGSRRPSRTVITVSALACLVVVVLAITAILTSLHHSTAADTGSRPASTPKASLASDASRARSATDAVLTATTTAQQGLHSLSGIPTVTKVTAVMTPYISSLQHYRTFLAGSTVPAAARGARANAAAVVKQDLQFLGTIHGLEPLRLGTYLVQFGSNTVELETTLSNFEQVLRSSTSLR